MAFLATAILLQPAPLAAVQAPAQGATISGTVTRVGTSEPIPDVNVLVTNARVGPRGQVLAQTLEEQVNAAIARGNAIPPNIQAQLDAQRAAARGGANTNVQLTTKSDRDGRFGFRDLPPGQYTVQIEREGYFGLPLSPGGSHPVVVNRTVTIAAGQTPANLALALVPGSAVSGRVVDPEGHPVVSSAVQAYRLSYLNGAPTLQAAGTADTDDRGDYRLFRIPPGEYYLAVTPGQSGARGFGGGRGGRGAIVVTGDPLVRTFHPDVLDANVARLFILKGGEDLTGIAINARRSPTIKVSGQVFSSVALPVQTNARGQTRTTPIQLILVPRGKNTVEDQNNRTNLSVPMDSPTDGKFEFPAVIPGSYDLFARLNNTTADPATIAEGTTPASYFGRTSFEAGQQAVSGLSVHIRPGVEVKTYVTVDGSAAAAANTVRVSLQPDESLRAIPAYVGRGGQLQPGPDGIVTFPFVNQGVYRVLPTIVAMNAPARGQRGAAQPLANAYIEDIRESGMSVYDNGLLVGKQPPSLVEIVIKTNGGTVQGIVHNAQLQPTAATIVLVPAEPRRQNIALYKTATSFASGHFGMVAVPPGHYKVFAWESIPPGAYQSATFIAKYEARGTSITVNAASTTNTQVTVIPADR
jgi:hypothetical protein